MYSGYSPSRDPHTRISKTQTSETVTRHATEGLSQDARSRRWLGNGLAAVSPTVGCAL